MAVQSLVTRSQVISLATSFRTHSSAQSTWQRATPLPTTTFNAQKHHPKRHISPVRVANSSATSQVATETPGDARVASEPAPSDLAGRWREIHGSNDWKGLLNPLDRTLREEILRYGEFTQATYDTFDFDDHSKYCGSARYNKAKMFEKVGLVNTGYEVTRYFYATANVDLPFFFKKPVKTANNEAWSEDSNWMGYVRYSLPTPCSLPLSLDGYDHSITFSRGAPFSAMWQSAQMKRRSSSSAAATL